jgi:tetratricopeptide (TPR) repeat protein
MVNILDQLKHLETTSIAKAYNQLGIQYNNLGKFEDAIKAHERALEIDNKIFPGQKNTDKAIYLSRIGLNLHAIAKQFQENSDIDGAKRMYSEAEAKLKEANEMTAEGHENKETFKDRLDECMKDSHELESPLNILIAHDEQMIIETDNVEAEQAVKQSQATVDAIGQNNSSAPEYPE